MSAARSGVTKPASVPRDGDDVYYKTRRRISPDRLHRCGALDSTSSTIPPEAGVMRVHVRPAARLASAPPCTAMLTSAAARAWRSFTPSPTDTAARPRPSAARRVEFVTRGSIAPGRPSPRRDAVACNHARDRPRGMRRSQPRRAQAFQRSRHIGARTDPADAGGGDDTPVDRGEHRGPAFARTLRGPGQRDLLGVPTPRR